MAAEAVREYSRRAPDDAVLDAAARERPLRARARSTSEACTARSRESWQAFDEEAGQRLNRCFYLATAPPFFPVDRRQLGEHGPQPPRGRRGARRDREAVRHHAGRGAASSTASVLSVFDEHAGLPHRPLPRARRRSRTCWRSASPTGCSSRCGTATTSTTSRSPPPRTSGSAPAPSYYDTVGALRDLIQNHMLQLLCHVAMEPPVDFSADEVRNEKVKVLHGDPRRRPRTRSRSIAVRAQYAAGHVGRRARARLPRGGGRPGRLAHRDLRRDAPGGRQLALGGRARSTCAPASASPARSPRSR